MNSMISSSKLLAAGLCVVLLAGCKLVEDTPDKASAPPQPRRQVIQGTVTGLGSERSMVLINNGDLTTSLLLTAPTQTTVFNTDTGPLPTEVHFSFGAKDVVDKDGNPTKFKVTVRQAPYGMANCKVQDNEGVLSEVEVPKDIKIDCTPSVPRFDLTVALNSNFANSKDAKVRLTTEEGIYEVPAAGRSTVTFKDALFNASTNSVNGVIPSPAPPAGSPNFEWFVGASNTEGGLLNRCPVTNPSNAVVSGNIQNPVADTAGPSVGNCDLTVRGAVHYSRPAGVTTDPALGSGGLTLELRDLDGNFRAKQDITGTTFPVAFTFLAPNGTDPLPFRANSSSIFQVLVTRQPAGQTCVVGDGGHATLSPLVQNSPAVLIQNNPQNITAVGLNSVGAAAAGATFITPSTLGTTIVATTAPTNTSYVLGTRLVVFCRTAPLAAAQLKGTYRLSKQTTTVIPSPTATSQTPVNRSAEWLYLDTRTQNSASASFLQFFPDGTFLYGSHAAATSTSAGVQIEHGFYEYTPESSPGSGNGMLRFTLHTDTGASTYNPAAVATGSPPVLNPNFTFPTAFGLFIPLTTNPNLPNTYTLGLSASPGKLAVGGTAGTTVTGTTATIANGTAGATNMGGTAPTGTSPAPAVHIAMCNVKTGVSVLPNPIGTTKQITGSFGTGGGTTQCGNVPALTVTTPAQASTSTFVRQLDWVLTEPHNISNEMTGAWVTRDRLRTWVFDGDSTYGTHIGVNGAANMQDACFTIENYHSSDSYMSRRGSSTGCYAWNRLAAGQAGYLATGAEAMDFPNSANTSGRAGGSPWLQSLPGWTGRIPGGETANDGRSPSPSRFVVSTPAEFFTKMGTGDAETVARNKLFFPPTEDTNGNGTLDNGEDANGNGVLDVESFAWCNTEILAVRATTNGIPINKPVYFCRNTLGAAGY